MVCEPASVPIIDLGTTQLCDSSGLVLLNRVSNDADELETTHQCLETSESNDDSITIVGKLPSGPRFVW